MASTVQTVYPGLKEFVAASGRPWQELYQEAVSRFGYDAGRDRFRRYASKVRGRSISSASDTRQDCPPAAPRTRTLDAFRKAYDDSIIIPERIEEGINRYLTEAGEPSWMSDRDFREALGVPVGKWRRYADDYRHLQVTVPGGGIVWGHPEIIDEMRKAVTR